LINSSLVSVTDVKRSFLPQVKFSEQLNAGSKISRQAHILHLALQPLLQLGIRDANNFNPVTGNVAVL